MESSLPAQTGISSRTAAYARGLLGTILGDAAASGHHRRSNFARRVFRPACDGRYQDAPSRPAWLVVADATIWPGTPIAAWPLARSGTGYAPPRGHALQQRWEDSLRDRAAIHPTHRSRCWTTSSPRTAARKHPSQRHHAPPTGRYRHLWTGRR
jgi:hypothetical protein